MLKFYQIDAFSGRLFMGNPAGVVPLSKWLSDETMQQIAFENNLAETAFFIKKDDDFLIRWFTPRVEVELCGHATLSAAHVLFRHLGYEHNEIRFHSMSGQLRVFREKHLLWLDFPADFCDPVAPPEGLYQALGCEPLYCYKGKTDYMLVYNSRKDIENMKPDMVALEKVDARGVIVTAAAEEVDFVSRFFGPRVGINEDPVTGSAHTTLTPYWSRRLAKSELTARQISERGGFLMCRNRGNRIEIGGEASTYLEGTLYVNDES